MTANRRIALNIIATYGRSLYALVIGLFCGQWTPMERWINGGENGKISNKGMKRVWQSCEWGLLMRLSGYPNAVTTPPLESKVACYYKQVAR